MKPTSSELPLIDSVKDSEEAVNALRLVLRDLPAEQTEEYVRTLTTEIVSGAISAEGLLQAWRGANRVGAAWFQILAGRSALVWPPRLVPDEPAVTAERLLAAGCRLLAQRDVAVANALLASVTREDDAVLRAAGFAPLASLLYMACEEPAFPQDQPAGRLEFEPWGADQQDRLIRLVEATYVGTLDCPAMNDLRRTEDVLAGYRESGVFSPKRWLFVRHGDRDAGCLLLSDQPASGNMELVYTGLVPQSRGRGFGKEICRRAQWMTRQAGRERLVTAVDAANAPAIGMYASTGFRAWDRREVYLKHFLAGSDSSARQDRG